MRRADQGPGRGERELTQALTVFAHDSTGPQRTLTLARYAILVEAAIHPPLRARPDCHRWRAAAPPTEPMIAGIRGLVGSWRHNVSYRETLIDILVHGQDITIPLGRRHDMPSEASATAASRVWSMRWPPPFPTMRKMKGFRLTATDTSWSVGAGPDVQAPMGAILLLCTGRLAALPQLSGAGAPDLTARLSAPPPS